MSDWRLTENTEILIRLPLAIMQIILITLVAPVVSRGLQNTGWFQETDIKRPPW
jgi:hypothetical protein